jgi:hypothetical protein
LKQVDGPIDALVAAYGTGATAAGNHICDANICPRFQRREGPDVHVVLFNSGCPFDARPAEVYKLRCFPLVLKTEAAPGSTPVNDDGPAFAYCGNWQVVLSRARGISVAVRCATGEGDALIFTFTWTRVDPLAEKKVSWGSAWTDKPPSK